VDSCINGTDLFQSVSGNVSDLQTLYTDLQQTPGILLLEPDYGDKENMVRQSISLYMTLLYLSLLHEECRA
jgi:hypothetical protein